MFDGDPTPRLFAVPPGVDFPAALIDGLRRRLAGAPPDAMARVELLVNTRRMARRLRELFEAGPPGLLPRIRLVTDLGEDPGFAGIPPAVPDLRRRLELTQLVSRLLRKEPDLAPPSLLYDLADSLAGLMDEMQGEGVTPDDIAALDVSASSGHWQRAQKFVALVGRYFDTDVHAPTSELRQRLVVERLIEQWQDSPPPHPVIVAGSTGSRGTTARLIHAVAQLPQGAVVLPGFDFDLPRKVWDAMGQALQSEDHPQFRFGRMARDLTLHPSTGVRRWVNTPPVNPARNALVSLSLRPAPVTDQWLSEGPRLADIARAAADITLIEAPSRRIEAQAIALRMRQAAETGQTIALITPDRMLARQVTAALDRWGIIPDDSMGLPLPLSAPGRLLRQVAALLGRPLTADALLGLLKHPLVHSGADRGPHLNRVRGLELHIRDRGMPFPTRDAVAGWAGALNTDSGAGPWAQWLFDAIAPLSDLSEGTIAELAEAQIAAAEALCRGSGGAGAGDLWQRAAGEAVRACVADLRAQAVHGGGLTATEYANLFHAVLDRSEVRVSETPHPQVLIWGTLEARVQGADALILGGLNEGTWPAPARPDAWLNRAMRDAAGLLLPERRIGLSAHDYQQAVCAGDVWLTRAIRTEEAETVPSRWLSRLTNLMDGLPDQGGPAALAGMRQRGARWLGRVKTLEDAPPAPRAARPSPRPPVAVRPRKLSVTEIRTLIRDPYAIYARHVLGLRPLNPVTQEPDAPLRGTVIHDILERFIGDVIEMPAQRTRAHLLEVAAQVLAAHAPWPTARKLWQARVARFADWFIAQEEARSPDFAPLRTEVRGRLTLADPPFTLTAKADRIDRDQDGRLLILDYKTGAAPTAPQQMKFDKQLLLEAAMAENGAFADIPPSPVARALFLGLGSAPKAVDAPIGDAPPAQVLAELRLLIAAYDEAQRGYTARNRMEKDTDSSDYDTLARFGEWDATQDPVPEDLA